MEGQFLVRQTYDDEITYNLIGAAVEILREYRLPYIPMNICIGENPTCLLTNTNNIHPHKHNEALLLTSCNNGGCR